MTWLADSKEEEGNKKEEEMVVDAEEEGQIVLWILELSRRSSRACVLGRFGVPSRARALCFWLSPTSHEQLLPHSGRGTSTSPPAVRCWPEG